MAEYLSSNTDQFAHFKQQAGYSGIPQSNRVASYSQFTNQSGAFNINSSDVKTGEVASLDKNRLGTIYGGNAMPGMGS